MTSVFFAKNKWVLVTGLVLFVLDRLSKQLAMKTLSQGFFIFPNFELKLYLNKDLAFSLPLPSIFIYFILTVAFLGLLFWFRGLVDRGQLTESYLVLALLVAGFSNLLDRIYLGGVVDFIHFSFLPIFNLADVYIALAVTGLLFLYLKKPT